jgi:hypothetical protein
MENTIIKSNDYYIDSFYRPVKCIKNDEGDLTGESLVHHLLEGRLGCEDPGLINEWFDQEEFCEFISFEKALEMKQVWEDSGEKGVLIFHGFVPDEADDFIKNWRKKIN